MPEKDILTIEIAEGPWARSRFPTPLTTVDFDASDKVLRVVFVGSEARRVRQQIIDEQETDVTA